MFCLKLSITIKLIEFSILGKLHIGIGDGFRLLYLKIMRLGKDLGLYIESQDASASSSQVEMNLADH